jgi:hypothetical protein
MVHADPYAQKTEAFRPITIAAKNPTSVSFQTSAIIYRQNIERWAIALTT